ncbi:hypothetical protein Psfp_01311 [Pelotomaculum sp. FP]|nr:hypothetical protein Psfp_01311 [Pelotomaculum sp. FP]
MVLSLANDAAQPLAAPGELRVTELAARNQRSTNVACMSISILEVNRLLS